MTITNTNGPKELNSKEKLLRAQLSKIVVMMRAHQMTCPQTKNKLVGVWFLMHGVANNVLLSQRGFDLDKPKSASSVNAFIVIL